MHELRFKLYYIRQIERNGSTEKGHKMKGTGDEKRKGKAQT